MNLTGPQGMGEAAGQLPALAARMLREAHAPAATPPPESRPTPPVAAGPRPGIPAGREMISLPAVPETQGPTAEERQKMVLRPGPVSLEDRLELVMSLEDVQRLLLLRSALPASQDQGAGTVDGSGTGQLLDLRS